VSSNLRPLGHSFNAQDKMDDFCDPSSRYFLVTERPAAAASAAASAGKPSKGKSKKSSSSFAAAGRPVAFAHFRFSVEGEAQEAMTGVPVLLLRDLHVAPAHQRKGVGKHLCQLLELAARKHAMHGVMVLAPAGAAAGEPTRAFLSSKLRGFECVDAEWAPADKHLSAFAKSLVKPPAAAAAVSPPAANAAVKATGVGAKGGPAPAASPDSILCGPGCGDNDDDDSSATPSPEAATAATSAMTPATAASAGTTDKDAAPATQAAPRRPDSRAAAAGAMQAGEFDVSSSSEGTPSAPPPAAAPQNSPVARLEAAFENATLSPTAPAVGNKMSFASFGMAPAEEDVSEDEEDGDDSEWEEVDGEEEGEGSDEDDDEDDAAGDEGDDAADDILWQLVDLFKAENGRDPSEEEMAQWVQTLKEAAAEGGLSL
jgi:hypothetical protein